MRTRFHTLLLAGAAVLGLSGPALAQVTVNGSPATIADVSQIVWNSQNISSTNPLPVAVVSGGGGASSAVTQGTTPWVISGNATANGSGNPIFTQVTALPGTGTAAPGTAATQSLLSGGLYNATQPTLTNGQQAALQLDPSGNLRVVDNSAVVSDQGAVTAAAPTYTAGTNAALSLTTAGALRTDGSSTTQPVSAAALPLPTGAATAANQNSTAAGTSATSAQAVQGVAGGVPLSAAVTNTSIAGSNRSASVTTTASTLMSANTARRGWKIKNDCTVPVWANFDTFATAAAGSGNFQIPAGGYLSSEPGFVETGALSVIAGSGTCALTVREY